MVFSWASSLDGWWVFYLDELMDLVLDELMAFETAELLMKMSALLSASDMPQALNLDVL